MPSISIDTFFACTLMVSVVIIATVSVAGTMMTRINGWKSLNEENYLRAISDNILSNTGEPANWGSDGNVKPDEFGLARSSSSSLNELDLDKICRLNSGNEFSLSYTDILNSSRLTDLAIRISLSQIMNIAVVLSSNNSQGDFTAYTFTVSVNQDSGPIAALLHCYVIARDFLQDEYSNTSTNGIGYVSFQIPNASNGTTALVVFARATQDSMMTAYNIHLFAHLSSEPLPNKTLLDLSPLNYTLNIDAKFSNTTLVDCYALTYSYRTNLTGSLNTLRTVPKMLDNSPIVLVVTGNNSSDFFLEWTSYPQIPFEIGTDFRNSESYVFSHVVIVKDTLYKLSLSFGGMMP